MLFILVSGIHSTGLLPPAVTNELVRLDGILLAMSMVALGLHTQAGNLFIFLLIKGYPINRAIV